MTATDTSLAGYAGQLDNETEGCWPAEPVPELLARVEALLDLREHCHPASPAAAHIAAQLRTHGRHLDYLDRLGLLRGRIADRYRAAVVTAASTAKAPPAASLDDGEALDQLAHWLRDPQWGVGLLEDIAAVITATGRSLTTIPDPDQRDTPLATQPRH